MLRKSYSSIIPPEVLLCWKRGVCWKCLVCCRDHERLGIEVEISCDRVNERSGDLVKLFDVSQDEGVLADQVDDAWNAAAGAVDGSYGVVGEDAVGGAGDEQALGDVVGGLLGGDGVGAGPEGDALAELADVGGAQFFFQ